MPEAHGVQADQKIRVSRLLLAGIFGMIALAIISSYLVIYYLSGNRYGAIYDTMSALVDVNDEGLSQAVAASVQAYTPRFYELIAVLITDGIIKAVIVGLAIAWIIRIVGEIDIRSRITRLVSSYTGRHILVCGYSQLGEKVCDALAEEGSKFIVIEKDRDRAEEAREAGYATIEGDFAERGLLDKAGIAKARAIALCTDDDFANLLGVVTARKANGTVRIVSKANTYLANAKMERAGASLCIMPEVAAGVELARKMGGR